MPAPMRAIARAGVVATAVLVLAWLGLSLRNELLINEGGRAAGQVVDGDSAARAESALRRARLLNPDTAPDLARALVRRLRGDERGAIALIEDVVRREPENAFAWRSLLALTRERDPATARRALAALRRLDPITFARR